MAYIPPHKRDTTDKELATPTPDLLDPQFKKNPNPWLSRNNFRKILCYAKHAISRWYAVGLMNDNQFPSSVCLEPISSEFIEQLKGEKPLVLVDSQQGKDKNEVRGNFLERPWVSIAENVLQDLLSCFQHVRNEMAYQGLEVVKPSLSVRFGKIFFHRSPSVSLETAKKSPVAETLLRQLKRTFYTNVTTSYMENIIGGIIPEIGVDFEEEKELYYVKLSDILLPDAIISCKCRVMKDDKKLELYKIEVTKLRHLVVDISCVDKNLDLRFMLYTKRILKSLTDNEKDSIRGLISTAVLDPDVKGGLSWPLGRESSEDRYSVVGVWHTKSKTYKSSSMRLQVREANRFDFETSTGEVMREVILKMTGVVSQLQEQQVEINSLSDMLKDTLKLIRDHFFCDAFLVEKEHTTDRVPTKNTSKETRGAKKEETSEESNNELKSDKKLDFKELKLDSITFPLSSPEEQSAAIDGSMEPSNGTIMAGVSESAPVIIEDTDSVFADLDKVISGASFQPASISVENLSQEKVAKAKTIFENCLPLDFKLLLHPGRQHVFLEAISILSSFSDFPSDKIFSLEKFRLEFPSLASGFQSSKRELEEIQKLIDSKVSLRKTLEQHTTDYKVIKTKEERINEEIKQLQEELKLKEEEKKEIISKKQDLARVTEAKKSILAKYNIEAPLWERKKKKAEDITSYVTFSWDNFKKVFV